MTCVDLLGTTGKDACTSRLSVSHCYSVPKAETRPTEFKGTDMDDHLKQAVLANAKWINAVLWSGFVLAAVVVVLRLVEGDSLSFQGAKIPVRQSWLVFLSLTLIHFYSAAIFVFSARRLWEKTTTEEYMAVHNEVVSTGGFMMRGMEPRLLPATGGPAPIQNSDLPGLIAHVGVLLMLAAMVPYGLHDLWQWPVALVICVANWLIGSRWAIALSELSAERDGSFILARRKRDPQSVQKSISAFYQARLRDYLSEMKKDLDRRKTSGPGRSVDLLLEVLHKDSVSHAEVEKAFEEATGLLAEDIKEYREQH